MNSPCFSDPDWIFGYWVVFLEQLRKTTAQNPFEYDALIKEFLKEMRQNIWKSDFCSTSKGCRNRASWRILTKPMPNERSRIGFSRFFWILIFYNFLHVLHHFEHKPVMKFGIFQWFSEIPDLACVQSAVKHAKNYKNSKIQNIFKN